MNYMGIVVNIKNLILGTRGKFVDIDVGELGDVIFVGKEFYWRKLFLYGGV